MCVEWKGGRTDDDTSLPVCREVWRLSCPRSTSELGQGDGGGGSLCPSASPHPRSWKQQRTVCLSPHPLSLFVYVCMFTHKQFLYCTPSPQGLGGVVCQW